MSPIDAIRESERAYAAIPYTETGDNVQRFSDTVNSYGLAGCQGQPWCATYQFAIELETVGKEQALKNWNMTASNYCGYSCFETEAKFRNAGKTGTTPRPGALVIFKQSHMGRVLSVNGDTFECGEGNTSNATFSRNGDSCAVKTYNAADSRIRAFCYIDYEDIKMNGKAVVEATRNVYIMAHNGHYRYGDSHATPPCSDGIISCDRLVARALWNLGYTQQPAGGITVINMESYLTKWGFKKITDQNALAAGDIVLMKQNGTTGPTDAWHTFVLSNFVNVNNISKYDCGSQARIDATQPFSTVLNEWPGSKTFYAAFRIGESYKSISPTTLKKNAHNGSAYLATEILKGRGYNGVYKDGKRQALELNFDWSIGDMAAMAQYKADRTARRANLSVGPYGAGEVGPGDWADLLGGQLPFTLYEIPTKQKKGVCVLLAQECLKARGIKGADGKQLELDQEWGDNTAHAWSRYCAARKKQGVKLNDKVINDAGWSDLTGL